MRCVTMPPVFSFFFRKKLRRTRKVCMKRLAPRKPRMTFARVKYAHYKERARVLIEAQVRKWIAVYGVTYGRVAIRDQKSRWGSCSRKGNLNFSYRLIFLPPELIEYVVVHEICHLREMNHSRRFWDLVAESVPDYRARRRELRALEKVMRAQERREAVAWRDEGTIIYVQPMSLYFGPL